MCWRSTALYTSYYILSPSKRPSQLRSSSSTFSSSHNVAASTWLLFFNSKSHEKSCLFAQPFSSSLAKYRLTLRVLSFLHLLCDFWRICLLATKVLIEFCNQKTFNLLGGVSSSLLTFWCPSLWSESLISIACTKRLGWCSWHTQSRPGSFFGNMLRPFSSHTVVKCFAFQNKLMNSSVHMILCFVFFFKRYHAAWCLAEKGLIFGGSFLISGPRVENALGQGNCPKRL